MSAGVHLKVFGVAQIVSEQDREQKHRRELCESPQLFGRLHKVQWQSGRMLLAKWFSLCVTSFFFKYNF